jgi:hypothetical protein
MAHAFLSPSGLAAALACELKVWAEKGLPDSSSSASSEGTAAHELAADCLEGEFDAAYFIGRQIEADGIIFTVDSDMASFVQVYLNYVRALGGQLLVEQRLPVASITLEDGATGTSDAVVLDGETLHVVDLKFGRGVQVFSENNAQLRCYGLAALRHYNLAGEFKTVVMHIVQPRMGHIDSETLTAEELLAWGESVLPTAKRILAGPSGLQATPNEKSCKFCRAKGSCPALQTHVVATVMDDFVDVTQPVSLASKLAAATDRISRVDNQTLANLMPQLGLIVDWCNEVRAEVDRRIFRGEEVPGYKVVDGKKGNREWTDEDAVRSVLDIVCDDPAVFTAPKPPAPVSPTQMEKVLKKSDPLLWERLKEMVTQSAGSPAVVPVSDKRPAKLIAAPSADDFDDVTTGENP